MFTEETLKNSQAFKDLITDRVALIHNPYFESERMWQAYIVIHSDMGKWTISRFWQSPNRKDELEKIHSNNDYVNISTEEVFKLLLSEYSRSLE